MRVVAINGSPGAEGNTFSMLSKVKEALEQEGVSTKKHSGGKQKNSRVHGLQKVL